MQTLVVEPADEDGLLDLDQQRIAPRAAEAAALHKLSTETPNAVFNSAGRVASG
jgi:hypothetical protein